MRLSSPTRTRHNRAVSAKAQSDSVHLLARMYEVWDAQDLAGVLDLLDPDFEWVNPSYAVHPGIRRGHEGMMRVMENLHESFERQTRVLGDVEELGDDRVLWHTVFQARGRDSGAQIEIEEQHLWTLRRGKILRIQWFHDAAEARRAAGLQRSVIT
jgi:ketosteroid isomerase-like protein